MMTNSVTPVPTAVPSLADEFSVAQNCLTTSKQLLRILKQYGITGRAIARAGGLGLTRVRMFDDCYWCPYQTGQHMLVVAAAPFGQATSCVDIVSHAVDLIAFNPKEPERWLLRIGGTELLGAHVLSEFQTVTIFKSPLAWLQGDATGIVQLFDAGETE